MGTADPNLTNADVLGTAAAETLTRAAEALEAARRIKPGPYEAAMLEELSYNDQQEYDRAERERDGWYNDHEERHARDRAEWAAYGRWLDSLV